ncbi:MAG TPA: PhpK family radical SAM P-methyltransferase [Candidatus Angelobacter sp.]|jgi:radical SAM PhpK family P-methyltransferase|nr:PhpK family radical SAM P-methyltransferase [Candidatus Angelobacter sp.]
MAIDTLIIGYNDGCLEDEVKTLRAMGPSHPNYRDLSLNMFEYQGRSYRAMDIFNRFYHEGRAPGKGAYGPNRTWNHTDVLWMVVMYLGTYLSRRGYTFDYINLFQLQKDELREKLLANEYLTVVVTTTIYNFDTPIIEVVKFVREHNPRARIIVGGPYIAKRSETMEERDLKAMFKYIGGDFYVRSREGEQALVNILAALKNGREFAGIPNIAYEQNGDFVMTPSEREINTLYENLIDYSLFPKEHIGNYVNIRITKGCPFVCSFCSFPLRTEKYNVSKLEYIQRELDAIRTVGTVTGLFFIDDTVNVPLQTFKDMMRMMIEQNYGFKWHCFFRADFCDEELVDLMAKAGCQGVFLGLESANDQLLINMHKTPRKQHYLTAVPLFKRAGIQVFASLFFGFPGETYDTAMETMEFLEKTKPDYYRPLIWYCDPVTPIWAEKEKYGIKGYHFSWSHNTMDVATACHLVERCFTTFDVPTWVPDPGFNFVSLFLQQNRGMSFDQIKTFLKCFNNVVKEKFVDPTRTEPSPHLIENLKRACQFDRPDPVDREMLEIFSDEQYKQDERFWFQELSSPATTELSEVQPRNLPSNDWRLLEAEAISHSIPEFLCRVYEADRYSVLIAAYVVALWRIGQRKEYTIVVALDNKEVFPVRVKIQAGSEFSEIVRTVQAKIEAGKGHRLFALRAIANMMQMPAGIITRPFFDGAYMETGEAIGPNRFAGFTATTHSGLEVILSVGDSDKCELSCYSGGPDQSPRRIGASLLNILSVAAEDPGVSLAEMQSHTFQLKTIKPEEQAPQFAF